MPDAVAQQRQAFGHRHFAPAALGRGHHGFSAHFRYLAQNFVDRERDSLVTPCGDGRKIGGVHWLGRRIAGD